MPITFEELIDRLHKRKLVRYEKYGNNWEYEIVDSLTKEQIDRIYAEDSCDHLDYKVYFEIKVFPNYYPWAGYCSDVVSGRSSLYPELFLNHFYGHLDIIEYHDYDKKKCIYDLTISLLESINKTLTLSKVKLLKFLLKQGIDIHKDKGDLTLSPYEYCLMINVPLVTKLFNNYIR